jgi:hypothetical protein
MYGKQHTKTLYLYFCRIKDKYRGSRNKEIIDIEKQEKKRENNKEKLGGVNHFEKQKKEEEFKTLMVTYNKKESGNDYDLPTIDNN